MVDELVYRDSAWLTSLVDRRATRGTTTSPVPKVARPDNSPRPCGYRRGDSPSLPDLDIQYKSRVGRAFMSSFLSWLAWLFIVHSPSPL